MQLMPALLAPRSELIISNYWIFIVVGVLIGAITTIIYAATLDYAKLHDVFFTALGIPAVLIGTTSNLTTNFSARNAIADVRAIASSEIQHPTPAQKINATPQPVPEPMPAPQGFYLHFSSTAWATEISSTAWATEKNNMAEFRVAEIGYLVVIGEYVNKDAAESAYRKYLNVHLQAERYVPKDLKIYRISQNFVLAYGHYTSREEAEKVYALLKINDPNIGVRLLQY